MGARDTDHRRSLIEACKIAGDEAALARRLGEPLAKIIDWLLGRQPIPRAVLLQAKELIIERNARHVKDTELFLQEVRRRNGL